MKNILSRNKSTTYSLFDQALVSGSNFISTLLVARLLGLYEFGVFATLWLVLLFINSLHSSIIVLPMMTLVSKQKDKIYYFGSLFIGQIIFLIVTLFISFLLIWLYLDYINYTTILYTASLFSILVLLYHTHDFYRRYFFSIKLFKNILQIDTISYLFRVFILFYIFIYYEKSTINNILFVFGITYFLGIFIALPKFIFKINKENIKVDFKQHWELSKWLLPSGFMQWSSINLFLVISSFILGPIILGAIRVGQNIVMAFNIILQGIENFIPIDASKIYKELGINALKKYLVKVTLIGAFIAFIFGILISIFSIDIISILYGNKYIPYNHIILWYSVILIFMYILLIFRVFLRTINETKIWFNAYLITSIYSVVTAYPLIYYFSMNGVMFGVLTAHIVLLISVVFLLKRRKKNEYQ